MPLQSREIVETFVCVCVCVGGGEQRAQNLVTLWTYMFVSFQLVMFKISILTNPMALLSSRFNGFSLIGPSQKKKNRERVYWTEDQTLDRRIWPKLKLVKRITMTKGYMETVSDAM